MNICTLAGVELQIVSSTSANFVHKVFMEHFEKLYFENRKQLEKGMEKKFQLAEQLREMELRNEP